MYRDFYGLSEKPFNTTPNPKFLYMSPGHREALAQLLSESLNPVKSRAQRLIFQQLPDRAGANRSNHRAHHRSYAPDFSEHVGTRRPFRHLCWGGRIR